MPIRRLTLEEWFLGYQLRRLARYHVHTPVELDVDVTRLARAYQDTGGRLPTVAVTVKALALTALRVPEANRAHFHTPFGERFLEPSHVSVNLPVLLEEGGREHVGATTVRDADKLTVGEIREVIRQAKARKLEDTWLVRRVAQGRNHLLNRLLLRGLHFLVYSFPQLWERKGGGALSVTALINERPGQPRFRALPVGPSAVTVFTTGLEWVGERALLRLGLGCDHCALTGVQIQRIVNTLHDVLAAPDSSLLP